MTKMSSLRAHALCLAGLWVAAIVSMGLSFPAPAGAATFPNLFTVTIPENPEASNARADASRRGMQMLLTRITGRREAGAYPEVAALVSDAERYLTSYAPLADQQVQVGFNGSAVTAVLTSLNWPLWGAERPASLIWVAIDFGDGQRMLLSASEAPDLLDNEARSVAEAVEESMRRAADERGLPIMLPLLDLQDRRNIGYAEVWGGFDPLIERASERYAPDAILIARVSITEFEPFVRWTVLRGGQRQTLASTSLREGIDWLADQFAAEFTIVGGARTTRIRVLGVDSLDTYGRIVSYLESVSILDSVDIESVSGNVLTLRVAARGDDRVLERVLTLGGVLELGIGEDSGLVPAFSAANVLTFRAVGSASEGP